VKNIMIPNMFYRTDIGERWHARGTPADLGYLA